MSNRAPTPAHLPAQQRAAVESTQQVQFPIANARNQTAPGTTLECISAGTRLPALDALRGAAILFVICYHFNTGPSITGPARHFFSVLRLGGSGVDLFFVLSGFLITGILIDAKGKGSYFSSFFIRRTLRIFPLYYCVLFLALVTPVFASLISSDLADHQIWLWCYGTNLYQAWTESYPFSPFDHFWSLAVEEHFYIMWPFVVYVCSRRSGMVVSGGYIIAAWACRAALALSGHHDIAIYVLTPCRMDALAAGALLAFWLRGMSPLNHVLWLGRASLIVSGLVLALFFAFKRDLARMDSSVLIWRSTLSSWFFSAVLLLSIMPTERSIVALACGLAPLRFFGKYSYGLYVFHPLLHLYMQNWGFPDALASSCASAALGRLIYIALGILGSVGIAWLSWHLYEERFLALKERLAPARNRPPRVEPSALSNSTAEQKA